MTSAAPFGRKRVGFPLAFIFVLERPRPESAEYARLATALPHLLFGLARDLPLLAAGHDGLALLP